MHTRKYICMAVSIVRTAVRGAACCARSSRMRSARCEAAIDIDHRRSRQAALVSEPMALRCEGQRGGPPSSAPSHQRRRSRSAAPPRPRRADRGVTRPAPLCGGTAPKVPNGTEQLDGGFVAQCVYLELRARPPTVAVGAARRGRDRCVVARLPTRAPPAFTLRDDTDTLQAAAPACMHQPEEADNKWSAQLPLPPKHAEWELSDQMANNAVPSGSAPAVAEADSSRCRMHRGALPGSVAVSSSRSAGPSTTNNPPPCLALAMVLLILTHSSKLAAAGCVRSSDCGHGTCAPPVLGSQV
jgi:hypothetical protein